MKAFIDGSSNGLYGYLLENGKMKIVKDYPLSNNQAEWLALLTLIIDLEPNTEIQVFSDSQIVVNQFTEEWETRNETLKHLKGVCQLVVKIKKLKISLNWIPRIENKFGKVLEKKVRKARKNRQNLRKKWNRRYK